MLNKDEVLELIKAGYTKDDISKFEDDRKEVEEVSQNDNTSDEEVTNSASNDISVDSDDSIDDIIDKHVEDAFSKLNASVDAFSKKLESFNLMNAEMTSQMQESQSIEDIILGSIVNPDGTKRKGDK